MQTNTALGRPTRWQLIRLIFIVSDHNNNALIEQDELAHIFQVLQINDPQAMQQVSQKPLTIDEFEQVMINHTDKVLSSNQSGQIEGGNNNGNNKISLGAAWGINEQDEQAIRKVCSF